MIHIIEHMIGSENNLPFFSTIETKLLIDH